MSLITSCSAQNKPRELKLAQLELSGNEDSEYVFKIYIFHFSILNLNGMSVKEMATQNVWKHHFSESYGDEMGPVGQIGPQR